MRHVAQIQSGMELPCLFTPRISIAASPIWSNSHSTSRGNPKMGSAQNLRSLNCCLGHFISKRVFNLG